MENTVLKQNSLRLRKNAVFRVMTELTENLVGEGQMCHTLLSEQFSTHFSVCILNKHAPEKCKKFAVRDMLEWMTEKVHSIKRAKRKNERVWRKSKLTVHGFLKNIV